MTTNNDLEYRQTKTLENSGTPYGDLTTVDRDNRIDVSAEYPLSEQVDNATAGVTRIDADSVFRIRANASTESLETVEQLQYTPGYIGEIGIALQIPTAPTGSQEIRWGYWNGTNGAYFGWDATGVFVEAIRNGNRQGKIYEDGWNEQANIDAEQALKNGAITREILALYNFGSVGFELFDRDEGSRELVNKQVHNLSVDGSTTLSQQNLPLRVEVDNPDASDLDVFVADRQATVRGNFTESRRVKGDTLTSVALSGTTWVPVVTIRQKAAFESIDVGVFSLNLKADTDLFIQFRSDAGSTTDGDYATPANIDAGETAIEIDKTPTGAIGDGYHRYQTLIEGGTGSKTTLGGFDDIDLELKRTKPFTMFARTTSATGGNISALAFNWEESW